MDTADAPRDPVCLPLPALTLLLGTLLELQSGKDLGKVGTVALTLAACGATSGVFLDGIHSRVGLLVYDSLPVQLSGLSTSLWVPPLLAIYYLAAGGLFLWSDAQLERGGDAATVHAVRHANLPHLAMTFGCAAGAEAAAAAAAEAGLMALPVQVSHS